jgi:hypothetical protein
MSSAVMGEFKISSILGERFKQYKQTANKAYNDYQLQLKNKLRNTSKYNGNDFWKILNRFAKNKKGFEFGFSFDLNGLFVNV